MAYYVLNANPTSGVYIDLPATQPFTIESGQPTRVDVEFGIVARVDGTSLVPIGRGNDASEILFIKSSTEIEYRAAGQTKAVALAGGFSTFREYKVRYTEIDSGSGYVHEAKLYVDDELTATWDFGAGRPNFAEYNRLFNLGSAARSGAIKDYWFTDNITTANSLAYNGNASGGTGSTFFETTGNGTNGTLVGFPTNGAQWVEYSVGPNVTLAPDEALVEVTNPVTDTTSIFNQLASGTIATGDYVHHTDSANTVVSADGTFTQTVYGNFDARAWDATDETWGAWVTIEVNPVVEVVDDWPFSKGIRPAGPVTWKYGNRHPMTQCRVRMKK